MTTPSLPESLHDFATHRATWRLAMLSAKARSDREDADHWGHEISAYDKAMAALDAFCSALAADRAATAPDGRLTIAAIVMATGAKMLPLMKAVESAGEGSVTASQKLTFDQALQAIASLTAPDRAANSLAEENDELHTLNRRLSDLLHRTANAIRGEPPPLTLWSFHDIPDRAAALVTMLDVMQRAAANLAAAPSVPPVGVGREAEHGSVDSVACSSPPAAALGEATEYDSPPCQECGALTAKEAGAKCHGTGDDCHGNHLWPDE